MPMPLIRKLEAFGPLPDRNKQALELTTGCARRVGAGRALVGEGDHPTERRLIQQGFAHRHCKPDDGQRQTMRFESSGDLQGFLVGQVGHGVATLTLCRVATLPHEVVANRIEDWPLRALWRGTLVDAVSRTRLLNVVPRTARERIARMSGEVLRCCEAIGGTWCRSITSTIVEPDRSESMLWMLQPPACVVAPTSENRYA